MFNFFPTNFLLPFLQPTKFQREFMNIFCPQSPFPENSLLKKKKKREKTLSRAAVHSLLWFLALWHVKIWSNMLRPFSVEPVEINGHPQSCSPTHIQTLTSKKHQPIPAVCYCTHRKKWCPGKADAMSCYLTSKRDPKWIGDKKLEINKRIQYYYFIRAVIRRTSNNPQWMTISTDNWNDKKLTKHQPKMILQGSEEVFVYFFPRGQQWLEPGTQKQGTAGIQKHNINSRLYFNFLFLLLSFFSFLFFFFFFSQIVISHLFPLRSCACPSFNWFNICSRSKTLDLGISLVIAISP